MNRCKYIQPVHSALKFGVDLNEIYPAWYLHPAIKNLIYLAESNVKCRHGSRFDIEELLSKGSHGEGNIRQRLDLKERLMSGKNIIDIDVPPGVPLWLIRHFLGLLPTPIFPPKYGEQYWYNFCLRLYEQFINSIKRRNACNDLKDTVAFELAHLPPRSITFLFEFFELIRLLSMRTVDDDVIDKHAALLFVRYYTPSMIVRPYRPGILSRYDKKYFAFILFCIHFWPDLREKIHNIFITSMNKNPDKFYYYPEFYDKYSDNNIYLKDNGTQTELDYESDLLLCIDSSSGESSDKRRNKITTTKHFQDKFESLNFNIHTIGFKHVDSDEESNHMFSSTPDFKKLRKENWKDINVTPKSKEIHKISIDIINKEKELPKVGCENLSPLDMETNIKNRLPLLEKVSSENIDQYYKTINKNNCKFLKTACTQTNLSSPKVDVLPAPPKCTVKTHARNKKIYSKKPKQKSNIVILQLPSTGKIKNKNVKILTYQKSTQKLLKIQNPKMIKSEPKTNIKDKKNNNESKEVSSIKHDTSNSWKMDSNVSNADFLYDSYVGNCYDETQSTFQPKKLFSTYSITPQPTPSVDLYKKITKYGWTYNNSQSNIQMPDQSESYKICFDNDEKSLRSLKSLTSETPLTEQVKKKKSITSSIKKIGSKLLFFKKKSSEITKSVSCSDLNSNVKYEKISKSANSI